MNAQLRSRRRTRGAFHCWGTIAFLLVLLPGFVSASDPHGAAGFVVESDDQESKSAGSAVSKTAVTDLSILPLSLDAMSDAVVRAPVAAGDPGSPVTFRLADPSKEMPLTISAAVEPAIGKKHRLAGPSSSPRSTGKRIPTAKLPAARDVVERPTDRTRTRSISLPKPTTVPKPSPEPQQRRASSQQAGKVVAPIAESVNTVRTSVSGVADEEETKLDLILRELEQLPKPAIPEPDAAEEPAAAGADDTPEKAVQENDRGSQNLEEEPVQTQRPQKVDPAPRVLPKEPRVVVTRRMAALQPRVAKALRFYFDKPLNTRDDSAWSIMHSVLGYGPNGSVAINGPRGRRTNAVHWLCNNNPCAQRRLLYLDGGYIRGLEGPGFQGHPSQFLAMMAQIGVPRDRPLRIQGQRFTIEDLVDAEMHAVEADRELTFTLIGLAHYLDSGASWKNGRRETWTIPRMLEIEMSQPVNGAACGGTHRIMAISYALRTRLMRGEPLDGVYARAHKYMRDYQQYALTLQNRDGSFSSDWFKRRSDWGDKDRQLQTTGHLLEWLVFSLPRNELSNPRVVHAVEFLTQLMTRHRYHEWEVGPRGHAIRALRLYHARVFERQPDETSVAQR